MKKIKKATGFLTVMGLMMGLTLNGCTLGGQQGESTGTDSSQTAVIDDTEEGIGGEVEVALDDQFGEDLNQFAFSLYEQLYNNKETVCFSPYSIYVALAMLNNGAAGETREELNELLNIKDIEVRNQQLKMFAEGTYDEKVSLETGNSLWLSEEMELSGNAEDEFLAPLKTYYNGELFRVNFSDDAALQEINDWVSEHTNGMINPFLNQLESDTDMCLINAVYFDGEWTYPFLEADTFPQPFYGTEYTTEVDMMHKTDTDFQYAAAYGLEGIRLPYGDGTIAMDIWIPAEDSDETAGTLFAALSNEEKLALFAALDGAPMTEIKSLEVPKIQVDSGMLELKEVLQTLGMTKSFDGSQADFRYISASLYVDAVMHKAKLIVDEKGTEASAVTGAMADLACLPAEDALTFTVDKPFLYCIRDCDTGVILFMGTMDNIQEK